jgi:hypothetical protein
MPKKNMGLKRKNLTGYMGGGVFKSNAPVSSSFRGGGATEVGTEKKVQSYKKYAKKMFGGGVSLASSIGGNPIRAGGRDPATPLKKDNRHPYLRKVIPNRNYEDTSRMRMTKADDRGFNTGGGTGVGVRSTSTKVAKVGGKPKTLRTPKKIRKRRPTFTPTKADDRGLSGGGSSALKKMRKKVIGIKKDRGLTAKSGARKGMAKKRVTRRGGG